MNKNMIHSQPAESWTTPAPVAKKTFNPEEIFHRIEQVRQGFEPEPGFLEQLFSPSQRRKALAISEAQISAIQARKHLIDGLGECIKTYIDAHRGDLKIRGDAFILETFARLLRELTVIVEQAYVNFYEVYSTSAAKIDSIPRLTDQMKQEVKTEAWHRAVQGVAASKARFDTALDELSTQVESVIREIGA